jgi:hypothetical protein
VFQRPYDQPVPGEEQEDAAAAGDKPDQVYAVVVVEGGPGQEEEEESQQKKKPDMADEADISLDIHRVRYKVAGKIQKIFYSGSDFLDLTANHITDEPNRPARRFFATDPG